MVDVLAHPELPWKWTGLSVNPNITFADVCEHPDEDWEWAPLSYKPDITLDDVLTYQNKPLNLFILSRYINATYQEILKHKELPWNWDQLYCNVKISKDDFTEQLLCRWPMICSNPNVIPHDLFDTLSSRSSRSRGIMTHLSLNPNLTFMDVVKFAYIKWDYAALSRNKFRKK